MATIGIGEDGEYADGFIRPVKEQIHVPFDDPRIPVTISPLSKNNPPSWGIFYDIGNICSIVMVISAYRTDGC